MERGTTPSGRGQPDLKNPLTTTLKSKGGRMTAQDWFLIILSVIYVITITMVIRQLYKARQEEKKTKEEDND